MVDTFFELKLLSQKTSLLDAIVKSQSEAMDVSSKKLYEEVSKISKTMIETIQNGLKSSELSKSKLSGLNTSILKEAEINPLFSPLYKKVSLYALATIEENARMGRISACPTAGSAGIVPAVLIVAYEELNKTEKELYNALIVAGEVGRIISIKMPLAGAVAGCQAECGVASAMATAGLCYFLNANIDTIFNAVSLNLKNILGLTCDPVAGLVEVPCVKRNVFLSIHAMTSAFLATAGIKSEIPIDDVIDAMRETGVLMSPKLKESSEAGLATTKTGLLIKENLYKIWSQD